MKKKIAIAVTAVLFLLIGILAIHIGTKPRDVVTEEAEKSVEETSEKIIEEISREISEEISEEILEDLPPQDWVSYWKTYWKERLVAEGKVKNPDEEIFFFEDYFQQPEDDGGKVIRATLQVVALDETGNLSMYQSVMNDPIQAQNVKLGVRVNIEGTELEEFDEIDLEDTILKLAKLHFEDFFPGEELDYNGHRRSEQLFHILAMRMKEKSRDNYQLLEEPVSAAELLLHLKGNAEEFIYGRYRSGYLKYNLADGKQVILFMGQNEDGWYPDVILNAKWEIDAGAKEEDLRILSDRIIENKYIAGVTADTLRNVTDTADEGAQYSYEWEQNLENKFILISKTKNENAKNVDAALYGIHGGGSMVLRVGDNVYPIWHPWVYLKTVLPVLYCEDFDGDGEIEYAIKTHTKTGTGISGDQLYIVEIHGDASKMLPLEYRLMRSQLDSIEYTYDEERGELTLQDCDGNDVTLNIRRFFEQKMYDTIPPDFYGLEFGDIEHFYVEDDSLYFTAEGGIRAAGDNCLSYDCSVEMTCPVIYSEAEGFSFGGMKYVANEFAENSTPRQWHYKY